ncbi:putative transmembrane protein [Pseudomonas sp. Os17]|nr:putative transmembrane protein [Pseudomonas sp. Os17]
MYWSITLVLAESFPTATLLDRIDTSRMVLARSTTGGQRQASGLIEGMAYSLSGDPRHPLGPAFEQWRSRFEAWQAGLGAQDLWKAARSVH